MATLTTRIMLAIEGSAYVPAPLMDYHSAQAVKAAMRRKDPLQRLSGVREALNQYRVSAWLRSDGRIELVLEGKHVCWL